MSHLGSMVPEFVSLYILMSPIHLAYCTADENDLGRYYSFCVSCEVFVLWSVLRFACASFFTVSLQDMKQQCGWY